MNSELVIPEGNKKTLAELVGVSIELSGSDNNNNKRSKVSTLARLNLTGKAIMGVKNIEGKDMNLEVIPAGAYELEQDDGIKVYCINPIIRVLTYREQWGRFDVENNKPNKSMMAKGSVFGKVLKDSTGGTNLGRIPNEVCSEFFDDYWKDRSEDYKKRINDVKRHKLLFGTIDFNGKALDEFGMPLIDIKEPIPFLFDVKNRKSLSEIDKKFNEIEEYSADQLGFPKKDDLRRKAKKAKKLELEAKCAENLLKSRFTLGSEIHDTGFIWSSVTIEKVQQGDYLDGDIDNLLKFNEWIEYIDGLTLNLWKENNVEQLSEAQAELVEEFVDVE